MGFSLPGMTGGNLPSFLNTGQPSKSSATPAPAPTQPAAQDPNKEVGRITINGVTYGYNYGGDYIKNYGNGSATTTTPTNNSSGYTYGNYNSNIDPIAAAYYGDQVNSFKNLMGTLPTLQQQGETNIRNSANKTLNDLNTNESQVESDIASKRQQAQKSKGINLSNIDQNVADTVSSFGRLVGAGHAGNSSFAKEFVPIATAREGSQKRQGVFNSFGQDMGNLDTTEKSAKTQYNSKKEDVNNKLNADLLSFFTGIQNQKDSIASQLKQAQFYQTEAQGGSPASFNAAVAPYNTTSDQAVAALKSLFAQYQTPNYNVGPVDVKVPDISSYTQDPLVAKLSTANPDTPLAYLPFLPQIKKQSAPSAA